MATKSNTKDDFPKSEFDVPLGHDVKGQPLPPVPHDPPQFAEPAAVTDHDKLIAQSSTQDRLKEMDRPPAQHGKGKDAHFAAVTSQTAPDGPLRDKDDESPEVDTLEES